MKADGAFVAFLEELFGNEETFGQVDLFVFAAAADVDGSYEQYEWHEDDEDEDCEYFGFVHDFEEDEQFDDCSLEGRQGHLQGEHYGVHE